MENGPKIRVIGNAPESHKTQAVAGFQNFLLDKDYGLSEKDKELFQVSEKEKTPEQIALIRFANQEVSSLMEEAGLKPYDIPDENYRLLPATLYDKLFHKSDSNGMAKMAQQRVWLRADDFTGNPVLFGSVVIHETMHLKSHISFELNEGEKPRITPYRVGVGIKALQRDGLHGNYHEHFSGLHEAIVSEAEKRLFPKMLQQPELKEEKTWLESDTAVVLKRDLAEKHRLRESNINWVAKEGTAYTIFQYGKQRRVLEYICKEISGSRGEEYPDPESVFKEFLKAQFTGHLLTIAKIVEETFGPGSFRALGEMDTTKTSASSCFEKMKELRAAKLKT